tara:strand:+ start:345 stop:533 length:189 start_codon:yes stop_codon:yes gene_type:complete
MNTYSFQTKDDFRIDVKASTPKSAYNKLKSTSNLITKNYYQYDKDGFYNSSLGWNYLKSEVA